MSDSHHSNDWYRISSARPRLRRDVRVVRNIYLGQPWYVLSDPTGTKVHRLTPAAQEVAGRLDGTRTIQAIWEDLQTRLAEDAPTQDEIVRLLSQLHQSDLLDNADTPMLDDLLERRDKDRAQKWKKLLLNPLSITLPLIDPDRFLIGLVRLLGGLPRALWWLLAAAIIATALAFLPLHWAALTARGLEGFLDLENLGLIALIYPLVKALHEIGHGVAVRSRGGEVHEMGLMFIAFYPIPYVEASASLAFPSKWDRAAVAAAGVVVELVIAACAFFLWIGAEPGVVRAVLFNTMIISGLSTLAVNGNPLLKFDGYHVLCDLIEIPNLAKRGNDWWGEMVRVHILGTGERARTRMQINGWERTWFALYPPAAFAYRLMISVSIALFVAGSYRLVGVLLAIWSITLMLAWPILKTAQKGLTDPRIQRVGQRAVLGAALTALGLGALVFAAPLPHYAVVQGVVWLPEEAILRAPQTARIVSLHAAHGATLAAGAPIVSFAAPDLEAEARIRAARLQKAQAQYAAARAEGRANVIQARSRVEEAAAARDDANARLAELEVTAALPGRLNLPAATGLEGRILARGAVIGQILPQNDPVIRVAMPQALAALMQRELRGIELRLADAPDRVMPAEVRRVVPAGDDILPSPVLALDGGGPFATVPGQDGSLRSATRLFQFDLGLPAGTRPAYGMRAYVRLNFTAKPLAVRVARAVRALFLRSFDV
ncbi:PqqD family peptide modification chaperone [Pseudooceanicola sp.]|uniref:PqqD family peptide modification chaperone n=1 Tax=Pseudooceanicola sp. TaxID=1914328 RepID=UPI0026227FCE|nr:PqqD family peptide modification chaperone [Pseudooceanicola sp.]MDF1855737.1 peptidase M50 [Pseudooceanicola sp.]